MLKEFKEFAIFIMVRWLNRLKTPAPAAAPATMACAYCLSSVPVRATRCPHCTSQLGAA